MLGGEKRWPPDWKMSGATMHRLGVNSKMKCALGLMSGTSMDGIDVALIRTDGQMQVERGPAMSFAYTDAQRDMIRQAVRDAQLCNRSSDRPGRLAEIERELTEVHGAAVSAFLRKQGIARATIDVIGFHGQTVAHRPDDKLTVQLGDGHLLAQLVRCPVVFDLRQHDVQAGGEGAPLAPVYHQALIGATDLTLPVAVVNIGGVANVTWIGGNGQLIAFDTGPGNALMDDWVAAKTGTSFDDQGALAATGEVDDNMLAHFMRDTFFAAPPPKSLDRDHFSFVPCQDLTAEDGAATLAAFTAAGIQRAGDWFPEPAKTWVVTGGGRHNTHLVRTLVSQVNGTVRLAEDVGLDGDSLEAEAWGYLAVRAIFGLPITFPGTTGVGEPLTGGIVVPKPKTAS